MNETAYPALPWEDCQADNALESLTAGDVALPEPISNDASGEFWYEPEQLIDYGSRRAAAAVLAERERCALEAEHWQKISTTPGHACGQYIAAAIRKGTP